MPYKIHLPEFFKDNLKELKKKYSHAASDAKEALELLETHAFLGTPVPRYSKVRKLRLKNSDISKGKRSGYRLLYHVHAEGKTIYPLFMYSKSDQEDVTHKDLKALFAKLRAYLKTYKLEEK